MTERGFIYAATGERWVQEAIASVKQLHSIHPDIPAVIMTDLPAIARRGCFDEVIELPFQTWQGSAVKLWAARHTPFTDTAFLDTDTYVCDDISVVFDVLERFDFAAVPVPRRSHWPPGHVRSDDIPDAFQHVNSGLFSWRRNGLTDELLALWDALYQQDREATSGAKLRDQPSLRAALWRSQCRVLFLPPEFNMRTLSYLVEPRVAVGPVRMIHGRPKDFAALARRWNAGSEPRFLTPMSWYGLRRVARGVVPRWVRRHVAQFLVRKRSR